MIDHNDNTRQYRPRAVTESEFDILIGEFGIEKIANILDECFVSENSTVSFHENAAEKITGLLLGEGRPLLVAFIATGTDRPRETVEKYGFIQLVMGAQQVAAQTFPGSNPLEIGNFIVQRILALAAPTSAAASGNLSRN